MASEMGTAWAPSGELTGAPPPVPPPHVPAQGPRVPPRDTCLGAFLWDWRLHLRRVTVPTLGLLPWGRLQRPAQTLGVSVTVLCVLKAHRPHGPGPGLDTGLCWVAARLGK